mgnify:FL=1
MTLRSPLHERTTRAGARFGIVADWEMPSDFGDALSEYRQLVAAASIIDCSNRGKLELVGPDAPSFLHNLCTNDILNLPLGGGCEAFFCTATAKVVDFAWIFHLRVAGEQDALWIDVAPGRGEILREHLERFHIAEQFEVIDRTRDFAQIHLAGPNAATVLATAIDAPVPELQPLQHMERTIGARGTCSIRRNDLLGVPGFDLVCRNERAAEVWDALRAAGAGPAGATAFEWLRVEAGTPIVGIDVDEARFVLEVGRAHAVSFNKGCYLGQEPIVMARDRAGHVNRTLRGLRLEDGPAVAPKSRVVSESGQDVGTTTSSAISPRFGPIALAYVRRGHEAPGTRLRIDHAGGRMAEVVALPFTESPTP